MMRNVTPMRTRNLDPTHFRRSTYHYATDSAESIVSEIDMDSNVTKFSQKSNQKYYSPFGNAVKISTAKIYPVK